MPPVSATRTDRFSKILFWVGILIIPTILIIQVLVYQPFFNHFNDGTLLRLLAGTSWSNSLIELLRYGGAGYGYPGARGAGWTLLYPQYEIASSSGAIPLFVTNTVLVSVIVALFAWSFARALALPLISVPALVLTTFLWPYSYDLIFFPSLEEKAVLLGASLTLLAFSFLQQTPMWLFVLTFPTGIAIGVNSKSQFAFFLAGILAVVALQFRTFRELGTRKRAIVFMTFGLIGMVVLAYQALFGSYNVGTRQSLVLNLSTFSSPPIALMTLVLIISIISSAIFLRFRGAKVSVLLPSIWITAFLAGIFYWGFRTYFLTVFGVMFGSAVAMVVGNLKSVKLQQLATVGLIVVTVGWTLYRIPQVFEPLHGIGAFTQGQIAKDLADEGAVIYTSCVEGSGHFNYYTERKWGVTPEFKPLEGDGAGYRFGIPDDGQYVFGDRRLCAAPGEMAEWEVIWASPGDDGFRLYKRPA
jgi:hypothetical protein